MRSAARGSDGGAFFWQGLGAAAVLGLVVRLVNAWTLKNPPLLSDAEFYHVQANLLADGHGFADPFAWVTHRQLVASAVHPPLFPLVLSLASRFGATSVFSHRVVASVVGVATVVLIGLIAREVAGPFAGVLAAVIAAVYPNLWGLDGSLMSEGLAAALVAAALLVALRMTRQPSRTLAALLGFLLALAALTRPEALILVALLAIPSVLVARLARRRKVELIVIVVAVFSVVLAPWLVRNLTGFSRPVLFSTNADEVLAVANCTPTYYTPALLGYWSFTCNGHLNITDDAARSSLERQTGLAYLRGHESRFVSAVLWARLGRVWDVYRPFENARYSAAEGRHENVAYAGLIMYWVCAVGALAGAYFLVSRNRTQLWQLSAPFVVVIVTAVYAYGAVRFRAIAEPSLIVLTATAVTTLRDRYRAKKDPAL